MNDSNFLICDNSNSSILRKWSDFCLDSFNGFPDQCFLSDHKLTFWLGLWCIINAVIGFAGNLLTILAIPYAANRKKYVLRHYNNESLDLIIVQILRERFKISKNLPPYLKLLT